MGDIIKVLKRWPEEGFERIKLGWEHYVGLDGTVVGMDGFGASAPGEVLHQKFGLMADNVAMRARQLLKEEG